MMDKDPQSGDAGVPVTAACIVAFDPDEHFSARVAAIASQVDVLIVVNNSKNGLPALAPGNIATIENENSGGLAGAINRSVAFCRERQYRYLAIFDHDSDAPPQLIQALLARIRTERCAVLGPRYVNSAILKPGLFIRDVGGWPVPEWIGEDKGVVDTYFVINSGSVLDIEQIPAGVSHSESLGVDMVDVDFCLRLKRAGRRVCVDTAQAMLHGIGNREKGTSRLSPTRYSDERRYLMARNRCVTWRVWATHYPAYMLLDVAIAATDALRNLLFLQRRLRYLRILFSGLAAGIRFDLTELRT